MKNTKKGVVKKPYVDVKGRENWYKARLTCELLCSLLRSAGSHKPWK